MDWSTLYGTYNVSCFDSYWSIIHFLSGILIGLGLGILSAYRKQPLTAAWYVRIGFILLLVWEYVEVLLRYANQYYPDIARLLATIIPPDFFEIETTANVIGDLVFGSIGLYVAYLFGSNHR